jgi:cobalt-zinc-cadmium efflux system membrane fusion protein
MRRLIIVVSSLFALSCESKTTAPPESKKPREDAGVLTIDASGQKKGGIVVEQVQLRNLAQTITASGQLTVNENRTWRVGAIADGKIEELLANVGDLVRAGQVVARIHSHDVHEARAGYRQASVELERARAAHAYAARLRDRATRLLELKAGSRQEVDSAEAEARNSEALIEKAKADLEKERAHLDFLHVPIDDPTQDDIPLFAPASGLVLERKAGVGSVVSAGDEVLSLTDPSSLWMIAAANESDLSKLRAGQPVRISVRAYPDKEFRGTILKLGEQLNPTTRTLQIRILVPNPQNLLKPEMFATASLEESGKRRALFVPEAAVQDINGVPSVFARRFEDQFEVRAVKVGRHENGSVEISEGLNGQEAVVVKGSFLLKSQMLKSIIAEE